VTVRKLIPLAIALGLWVAGPALAQDEAAKARNQKLADAAAEKLKSAGVVKGASVDIETRDGVVDLTGTVTSEAQHEEIIRVLKSVNGVKKIQSWLAVGNQTSAPAAAAPVPAPAPATPMPAGPLQPQHVAGFGSLQRAGGQGEGAAPISALPAPVGPAPMIPTGEPLPLNGAPAMAPLDPAGPRLPPYAWPTYAPYNNMSRVAYPQSYPYNAFPYIGPYYPFPRVPLGWRKVTLEWEDGHWYYGRLAGPHDFWKVKFW
jgi:hypothetical protein